MSTAVSETEEPGAPILRRTVLLAAELPPFLEVRKRDAFSRAALSEMGAANDDTQNVRKVIRVNRNFIIMYCLDILPSAKIIYLYKNTKKSL